MVTLIKRGTARRLGLRRPYEVPEWIARDLTEWQVDILRKVLRSHGVPARLTFPGRLRGGGTVPDRDV